MKPALAIIAGLLLGCVEEPVFERVEWSGRYYMVDSTRVNEFLTEAEECRYSCAQQSGEVFSLPIESSAGCMCMDMMETQ